MSDYLGGHPRAHPLYVEVGDAQCVDKPCATCAPNPAINRIRGLFVPGGTRTGLRRTPFRLCRHYVAQKPRLAGDGLGLTTALLR